MKAAKNCSFLISKKMLEDKNTNYNLRDHNGKTALTYATEGGCSLIVNQLLEMPSIDRKLDLY
jgi:ankyrin repeat protein